MKIFFFSAIALLIWCNSFGQVDTAAILINPIPDSIIVTESHVYVIEPLQRFNKNMMCSFGLDGLSVAFIGVAVLSYNASKNVNGGAKYQNNTDFTGDCFVGLASACIISSIVLKINAYNVIKQPFRLRRLDR